MNAEQLIKPVNDLFQLLYTIKSTSIEKACSDLLQTEWVHDESSILEMISCILQVIRTNIRLHSSLLDLIRLLDEELHRLNIFGQFLPLFSKQLLNEFNQFNESNPCTTWGSQPKPSNESLLCGAFLYKLKERNMITFGLIKDQYQKCPNGSIGIIFRPELEKNEISIDIEPKFCFNLNEYSKLRENFEPSSDLLQLIIKDDSQKLEIEISQSNLDINKKVPLNSLIHGQSWYSEISLINYAAENGSINCFNYLRSKIAKLSNDLLISAVKGGNDTIIQRCFTEIKIQPPSSMSTNFCGLHSTRNNNFDTYLECLKVAIKMHRYSLIKQILLKIKTTNRLPHDIKDLYYTCTTNGNAMAILIFQKCGIDMFKLMGTFSSFDSNIPKSNNAYIGFETLIQRGFYHFIQFLLKLRHQEQIDYLYINDPSSVVRSQNPKILQLLSNLPVNKILYSAIQYDFVSLADYIMKNFHYYDESRDYYQIYLALVTNNSASMFQLITPKYPIDKSIQFVEASQYLAIVNKACKHSFYEPVERFTELLIRINEYADFTEPCKTALLARSSKICEFFLTNPHVNLDLISISEDPNLIQLEHGRFTHLLYEKANNNSIQLQLFYSLLSNFITSSLKEQHKEYMSTLLTLNKSDQISSLFQEMSLNSPFVSSMIQSNLYAVEVFLDYFGDNISKQASQINFGLIFLLENYLNDYLRSQNPRNGHLYSAFSDNSQFINLIQRLFKVEGVNPDVTCDNETFLTLAVKRFNPKLATLCLNHMKDPRILNKTSLDNPFINAIKLYNIEIVNAFLDYFKDNNNIAEQIPQINIGLGLLLNDYNRDFRDAIRQKKTELITATPSKHFNDLIQRLFEVEGVNTDVTCDNETFLTLAVKRTNPKLATLCLNHMKDLSIFDKTSLDNPFIKAIKLYNIEIVNAFLDYFKDNNNIAEQIPQINFGLGLLLNDYDQYMYHHQSPQLIKFIQRLFEVEKNHPDIDFQMKDKFLAVAVKRHDEKLTDLCLDYMKDLSIFDKTSLDNPFINAIKLHNIAIVDVFLDKFGDNISKKASQINTGLTLLLEVCKPPPNLNNSEDKEFNNILVFLSQFFRRVPHNFDFEVLSMLRRKFHNSTDIFFLQKYIELCEANPDAWVESIRPEERDQAFYFCNDKSADDLIHHPGMNINVNYIYIHTTIKNQIIYSTSLLNSIKQKQHEKTKLILNHPKFDRNLSNANEAVFLAIPNNNFEVFNRLLDFVDDINLFNSKGQSLLSLCCESNFAEGVKKIINHAQFDQVKIHFGTLLLTLFQEYPHSHIDFSIIEMLVEYDSNHSRFLHFDQLLPNGKSFFTQIKPIQINPAPKTVYYFTQKAPNQKNENTENNQKIYKFITFLLEKGVDPNTPDRFDVYPLQHAIQIKSLPFVQALLNSRRIDYSIKINTPVIKNGTYLHLSPFTSKEIVQDLISRNEFYREKSTQDDSGNTPYMIAQLEIQRTASTQNELTSICTLLNVTQRR